MKREFTKAFMLANCGCYTEEQLLACSFMGKDVITLDDILNSEIPFSDKCWFVYYKCCNEYEQLQFNKYPLIIYFTDLQNFCTSFIPA